MRLSHVVPRDAGEQYPQSNLPHIYSSGTEYSDKRRGRSLFLRVPCASGMEIKRHRGTDSDQARSNLYGPLRLVGIKVGTFVFLKRCSLSTYMRRVS